MKKLNKRFSQWQQKDNFYANAQGHTLKRKMHF